MIDQRLTDQPTVILDLSRLLSRIRHMTPTGVDRVEMAYARELLRVIPDRLEFAALTPLGQYGRLPRHRVVAFLDRTELLWSGSMPQPRGRVARALATGRALAMLHPQALGSRSGSRVLLQVSPHHLVDEQKTASIIARERAKFVCLLHDLIPIEYPEYARPNGAGLHVKRIRTVARHASGVIAISESTRRSFLPFLAEAGRDIPVTVAHLGLDFVSDRLRPPITLPDHPYFVCIGTIEPRKNHLLLLNIWRRFAETVGDHAAIPKLLIIGRRGWENENILDMLDRCPALRGHVEEQGGRSDDDVQQLLTGACALLMPTFAEGFGLPVAEALQRGVPVIASDIPALREVGGDAPDYIDPIDGPGWAQAIRDYAIAGSPRRAQQLQRIAGWRHLRWSDHIDIVRPLLEALG